MRRLFDDPDQAPPPIPIPKAPAQRGESGFDKLPRNDYFTEPWAVECCLKHFEPRGRVLEPSCGDGAICKVLAAHSIPYAASDLHDYGFPGACSGVDFLAPASYAFWSGCIMTNPPYDLAEQFLRHALNLTRPSAPGAPSDHAGGQVCMLLQHKFDCAKGRTDLWEMFPFVRKITLTRRLKFFDGPNDGRQHHAWYVWDWGRRLEPHQNRWAG